MAEVTGNNSSPTGVSDESGDYFTVQNPLPIGGDSIYCQNLDLDNSDIGDFSGSVCDLFDNYRLTNIASSVGSGGANPKSFTVAFHRPIAGSKIGIGSPDSSISNVKIFIKALNGEVVKILDNSSDNTKRAVAAAQFEQKLYIEVTVEFHTDDEVSLGGMAIFTSRNITIDAINGIVSGDNSKTDLMVADEVFIGGSIDTLNYGIIIVTIRSDVVSAIDGLDIQFSFNPTGPWYSSGTFSLEADRLNVLKPFSVQTVLQYMRVIYTNGPTDQGMFLLSTQLKPVYIKPSSHRVKDPISGEDDAELVINVNKAEDPSGVSVSIGATASHNLKTANSEDNLNIAQGNVVGHSTVHKFGRGANIDTADGFVALWDGSEFDDDLKTYTFSLSADIDRISSDNNGDTVDIEIQGLDINGDLVIQTITLTGQTPAVLDTPLWRVFRMINMGAVDISGNVFCFVNVATSLGVPDTITNTRAMISNGNNQTLMAIFTIPNGKTAFILNWYGALSSAKASSFNNLEMRARREGGVFQLKHTSTLSSAGASHIQHFFDVPQSFPAKTDFIMYSDSSVNDNAVSAGFDLILIDN